MAKKSLVGNIYGDIEAIEYTGNKKYKCKCIKCGDVTEKYSANLKGNMTCKKCTSRCRVDLSRKQYGYLTVLEYNNESKKWICECKCGRKIEVKSNNLKSGNTSSCGKCKYTEAAQRDVVNGTRVSQIGKRMNKNNTSGITGVGYNKRKEKWYAAIRFCGKKYWLGYYDRKEDAAKVRKEAEDNLHGDFLEWLKNRD